MGLSSSKSTTKSTNQQQETGTTTPFNLPGVDQALIDMTDRIGAFGDRDPNSFVAGPSPLQQMAWGNANSLADWQPQARLASERALAAGQAGPSLAGRPQQPQMAQQQQSVAPQQQGPAYDYTPATGQATSFTAPTLGSAPRATGAQMAPTSLAPTATGTAQTWQAPSLGVAPQGQASSYQAPNLGPASSWQAPSAGQGALVAARGYTAPQLGSGTGYAAPRIGAPIGAQAQSYTTQPTERVAVAPTVNAAATDATGQSLLTGLNNYRNPWDSGVRMTALQDFDIEAERTRARQMAEGARAGAFGGSRFGVAQAQTEENIARARAALDAQLLSQGFDRAASLSEADTGRRQETSLFNAGNRTGIAATNAAAANQRAGLQAGLSQDVILSDAARRAEAAQFGAGSRERASFFNSGAQQERNLAQAGLDDARARYTADITNRFTEKRADMAADAGQFTASLGAQSDALNQQSRNSMAQFNTGLAAQAASEAAAARNQYGLAGANLAADARRFSAGNAQDMALANLDMRGRYGLTGAELGARAASENAAAGNQYGLANMSALNDNARFRAGLEAERAQANAGFQQQADLASLDMLGRYGLTQGQMGFDAASQNAAAANQYGLANVEALNTSGQWNAGANNQMSQFDANMQEQAFARQLQAAGMLGDISSQYGANVARDLALMGDMGAQQRMIEAQYHMAPLAQLQALGELYGTTPYGLFAGTNVSATGSSSGTSVTKNTPSLFSSFMQMGENLARAYAGGAG